MKRIRYVIPKISKVLFLLLFLLFLCCMYLFSYNQNILFYHLRYLIYFLCIFRGFLPVILYLIWNYLIFSIRFDEKEFLTSIPYRRKKRNVPLDTIRKVIINKTTIWVFGIKEDKEYEFTIPLLNLGFIHKEDFLYIMNLFNGIETEYDDVTQEEVLKIVSKQILNKKKIHISIICTLFLLFATLLFILFTF